MSPTLLSTLGWKGLSVPPKFSETQQRKYSKSSRPRMMTWTPAFLLYPPPLDCCSLCGMEMTNSFVGLELRWKNLFSRSRNHMRLANRWN
eukprot:jgi/Mesvir1/10707/Mv25430-RA.1